MAWNNLKTSIAQVIKANDNQEITGPALQGVLNNIVDSIGANYTYAGVATTSTSPGTPDGPIFYLTAEGGVYINFNNITVTQNVLTALKWDGTSWSKEEIAELGGEGSIIDSDNVKVGDKTLTNDMNELGFPVFEIGNITITNSGWTYGNNDKRIRTKQGTTIHLVKGDIVKLTDYTNARFYLGVKKADGTYTGPSGWQTADYTCEWTGEWVVLISNITETTQTDTATLGNLLRIVRCIDNLTDNLEALQNETIVHSRNQSAVDTAINESLNISSYPVGTLFKLTINQYNGGNSSWEMMYDGKTIESVHTSAGVGVYYMWKMSSVATTIRLYMGAGTGNILNYDISVLKQIPHDAVVPSMYYGIAEEQGVSIYNPSKGYPTAIDTKNTASYFSSSEMFFSRGLKFKVTFDTSLYTLFLYYNYRGEKNIVAGQTITNNHYIDTSQMEAWCIALRRNNYSAIPPETIQTALTISDVTGIKYDKGVSDKAFYAKATQMQSEIETSVMANIPDLYANPFKDKFFYHHLNVEAANPVIPSQSLLDIAYAKKLGFKFIEANVQKCSDNVYVTKHGNAGKLGAGLQFASGSTYTADTLFSAVTSTKLRQEVSYNCQLAKNNTFIPTLEEFCAECSKQNIGIFVQCIDANILPLVRKYLPDDMIIAYGLSARGDFKGIITHYVSDEDADAMLARCQTYGKPYAYCWNGGASVTDADYQLATKKLHDNGYLLTAAYPTVANYLRLSALGLDGYASTHHLINNDGFAGNIHDITSASDNALTTTDVTVDTNNIATIATNGLIKLDDATLTKQCVKVRLSIRYNGTLTFAIGSNTDFTYDGVTALVSDGSKSIDVSAVAEATDKLVYIKADASTTIYDFSIKVDSVI